jgi:hypothetical protein
LSDEKIINAATHEINAIHTKMVKISDTGDFFYQ